MEKQKEFFYQAIQLTIDKDDELYKRLETQAERYGMTIEQMVNAVGAMGLMKYISRNLAVFEQGRPSDEPTTDRQG